MRTSSPRAAAVAATLAVAPLAACEPPPPEQFFRDPAEPYHILVSNDDGIASPGIQRLASALRAVGEVTVVAPCGQRSGSGMSIRLDLEKHLERYEHEGEPGGHCVEATPAGAVLVAIDALAPEGGFDLVVSGINAGANVGAVAPMSGTVGAAMMGAYKGVPAVAASLGDRRHGFDYAAAFVARFVEELKGRTPRPGIVFSVNFPAGAEDEIAGVAVGRMGGGPFGFGFEETGAEDGVRVFSPRFGPPDAPPPGSDAEAFAAGMITITPLRFDLTADEMLEELAHWDLDRLLGERPGR